MIQAKRLSIAVIIICSACQHRKPWTTFVEWIHRRAKWVAVGSTTVMVTIVSGAAWFLNYMKQ